MMAAIAAARAGAQVVLFEQNDRVGKKILSTGNGKCNFSNRQLSASCYYGEDKEKLLAVLERFGTEEAVAFFEQAGMLTKEKNGYLYPASEQAATVLDILRMQLQESKVQVLTESRVTGICRDKDLLWVEAGKRRQAFDRVILSCGGKAAPKTGSDGNGYGLARSLGHTLIPTVPALVQLKCREELKAVAGVRLEAVVRLFIDGREAARERGELQLTEYGISGIVVFQLSRLAAYGLSQQKKVQVYIDCLPDFTKEAYQRFTASRQKEKPDCTAEAFFTGMLNKKVMLYFCRLAGIKAGESWKQADPKNLEKVFSLCRCFPLTVSGTNSFDNAQVTAGGIPLSEVNNQLESLLAEGVYFAGEMLDVDGKCGGYNLQWAWASGYVAGTSAALDKCGKEADS